MQWHLSGDVFVGNTVFVCLFTPKSLCLAARRTLHEELSKHRVELPLLPSPDDFVACDSQAERVDEPLYLTCSVSMGKRKRKTHGLHSGEDSSTCESPSLFIKAFKLMLKAKKTLKCFDKKGRSDELGLKRCYS